MLADPQVDIAVFARAPDPGHAKTRLIPRLGAAGAARLQEQLIERALTRARSLPGAQVTLWTTGRDARGFMARTAAAHDAQLRKQRGDDLGARMSNAVEDTLDGHNVMLLIGTDCPAQQPADLAAAVAALEWADAVIQPAEDGGYVLVGLRRALPRLFEDIAWGRDTVLAATRARARDYGVRLAELRTCWDLDHAADLDRALAAGLVEVP
jgi:rSAM/selenodomain-associated transferase 1